MVSQPPDIERIPTALLILYFSECTKIVYILNICFQFYTIIRAKFVPRIEHIFFYKSVFGLDSTQALMLGTFPTLSVRLASLGNLASTALSTASVAYM